MEEGKWSEGGGWRKVEGGRWGESWSSPSLMSIRDDDKLLDTRRVFLRLRGEEEEVGVEGTGGLMGGKVG